MIRLDLCFSLPDSKGEPLRIVNTSDVSDGTLLKLLFIKVSVIVSSVAGINILTESQFSGERDIITL